MDCIKRSNFAIHALFSQKAMVNILVLMTTNEAFCDL